MQAPVLKPKIKFAKQANGPIEAKYKAMNQDSKLNSVAVNGRTYPTNFSCKQLSKIYNCPAPNLSKKITIGIISLGGGLAGTLTNNILLPNGQVDHNSGTLTNGDIQYYWNWQGIPSSNWPTVIVKSVDGTKNTPSSNPYSANYGATIENTLDIETVGTWCSSSNVTIIMYLAKNNNFYGALNYAINSNVVTSLNTYRPSVISISWGAPEILFGQTYITTFDTLCSNAAYNNINICVASGDLYSKNGLTSNSVDFPSSSAWVTSCGGTSLICPGNIYTNSTVETVWNNLNNQGGTGDGISIYIPKPSYQSNIKQSTSKRCVPDVVFNSDPYTGLVYYINGSFMEGIGGTSVAAPAMAGLIASLNISTFINPILYSISSNCFHDIKSGNNIGYSADNGYGSCTGLGSINGSMIASTLSIRNNKNITSPEQLSRPYFKQNKSVILNSEPLNNLTGSSRPWFTCLELATIYGCPAPPTTSNTIGVISLGGGLFGTLNSNTGVLTGGDVHQYWTSIGIPLSNHPRVIIKTLGNSRNIPSSNVNNTQNYGATIENTVDVETIGAWYPSSKLTIIMYLANQYVDPSSFYNTLNYAINSNVVIGTNTYSRPSTISVSWGFTEIFNANTINSVQPLLASASARGINIFCATGDYGSTDGIPGVNNYTNFPSCSPNVIACGGTTLICPNYIYDSATGENTWTDGGGGISRKFSKPSYQSGVTKSPTMRCTPDISLNANPTTGVYYIFASQGILIGGTSIVSPAMAAFTSILNINYFLNTKIYTINSQSFHDIKSGNNGGYTANLGYDLCTGRGTLNGQKFISFLNPIATTGITISPNNPIVKVKTTIQLTTTIQPENATNQLVTWSSSKPKIVSVSSTGLCTAKAVGRSVITATQGLINAHVTVTVKNKLNIKNVTLEKDKSCIIKLSTTSSGHVLKNNSESIVDCILIDNSWKIVGKMPGEAMIVIEYMDNEESNILYVNVV